MPAMQLKVKRPDRLCLCFHSWESSLFGNMSVCMCVRVCVCLFVFLVTLVVKQEHPNISPQEALHHISRDMQSTLSLLLRW